MADEFTALAIDDYAKQAARTDQRNGKSALGFSMLGLFGEAGSLTRRELIEAEARCHLHQPVELLDPVRRNTG